MKAKGIGKEYRQKLGVILTSAKGIITPALVAASLDIPRQEAGRLLSRLHEQGWIKRLKRGVYIPIAPDDMSGASSIEDPWVLADRLFNPGYIGGFSAVKHWDFSEQLFETTTYFTIKKIKDRRPVIGNTRLHLKTIKKYKIVGTKSVWRENTKILVSDASKTIVDLLDDPTLVGGMRIVKDIFIEYQKSEFFNIEKIIEYAEKMHNKTIFKRFGFLMEILNLYDIITQYNLLNKISSGYSLFDPSLKNTIFISKWKLKIPTSWKITND